MDSSIDFRREAARVTVRGHRPISSARNALTLILWVLAIGGMIAADVLGFSLAPSLALVVVQRPGLL